MTYPGAPGIYYGDELGMEGGDDPHCRGAMPWSEIGSRDSLIDAVAGLTTLRKRAPALRLGEWAPLTATSGAVAYERCLNRSRYVVGINRSTRTARLDVGGSGSTVWGDGGHEKGTLRIAARSAVITRS